MSAGTYYGPLLDTLADDDELYQDLDQVPPCSVDGAGRWGHKSAILTTLMSVTASNVVTLTRRQRFASFDETPGEITGYVIGGSTRSDGRIFLVFDSGAQVDVSDPGLWHWEVHFDGDSG